MTLPRDYINVRFYTPTNWVGNVIRVATLSNLVHCNVEYNDYIIDCSVNRGIQVHYTDEYMGQHGGLSRSKLLEIRADENEFILRMEAIACGAPTEISKTIKEYFLRRKMTAVNCLTATSAILTHAGYDIPPIKTAKQLYTHLMKRTN